MDWFKSLFGQGKQDGAGASKPERKHVNMEQFLAEHGQPSLRFFLDKDAPDSAPGNSQIGGHPLVPSGFQWPRSPAGYPLTFLCQVDCADIAGFAVSKSLLPAEGLISFFYDANEQPWGFDPKDRGSSFVAYAPKLADLSQASYPDDLETNWQAPKIKLTWREEMTYPDSGADEVEAIDFVVQTDRGERVDNDRYFDHLANHYGKEDTIYRLLGHPQLIQGDLRLQCQLVSAGLYCGDTTGYADKRVSELEAGKDNWILLLQLDSDDDARMCWGDGGRLFFCIEKDALARRDFSRVWTILQCY